MRKQHLYTGSAAALILALVPAAAQAADLVQTLKDQGQFSELVDAIEQAGLTQSLQGEGPFTVFAPTDEAFGKLPEGAVDQLAQGNGQLGDVLEHHVVEGQEIMAKDVLGKETEVSTLSGDQLTVDGTATMMVLVPAGLQVTRVGDQIFVQREVGAMAAPAVTVTTSDQGQQAATGGQEGQQQQQAGSSATGSQQQQQQQATTGGGAGQGQHQTAGTQNPEAAAGQQLTQEERSPAAQQAQQESQGSQTQPMERQATTAGGAGQDQQTAGTQNPEAAAGQQLSPTERSPAAHQAQQAGEAGQGQPMEQQQGMLRAAMVVEPDIQADNGVIHAINEVLVPQKIEQQLSQAGSQQGQQDPSN